MLILCTYNVGRGMWLTGKTRLQAIGNRPQVTEKQQIPLPQCGIGMTKMRDRLGNREQQEQKAKN